MPSAVSPYAILPIACIASIVFLIAPVKPTTYSYTIDKSSRPTTSKSIMRVASISIRNRVFDRMRSESSLRHNASKQRSCCFVTFQKHPYVSYSIPSNHDRRKRGAFFSSPITFSMSSSTSRNWEQITNHQTSKTVKLFKSIHRANKAKRSELGLTVAEGVRLVSDILANEESRQLVRRIVISESLLYESGDQYQKQLQHWLDVVDQESKQRKEEHASGSNAKTSTIRTCSINIGTEKVVDACSGTVTSQGVVALMEIPPPYEPMVQATPEKTFASKKPPFYLILDGLSDPGNVGTLLRTCAASHVTALILLPGSCDVWNPKAVRSAMGASFRVPVLEFSKASDEEALKQVLDLLERCGVENERVFAATMEDSGDRASLAHFDIDFACKGAAIILGREGEGLRSEVRKAIQQSKISTSHVPMAPGMESLNAAVCGSVIMFERLRQLIMNEASDEGRP